MPVHDGHLLKNGLAALSHVSTKSGQFHIMLTDLEAVFRCLKPELGLSPVYHQKTDRVSGHLFISVLAYHLVHTLRFQLKACGIHLRWEGLRRELGGQDRVTVELKRADGKILHVRKAGRPEPRQQRIYDALGIPSDPRQRRSAITALSINITH
jgi:hypothetical protein